MLNRLNLQVNPNNQLVLTVGNYAAKRDENYYLPLEREEQWRTTRTKERLARRLNNLRLARLPKFDWRGDPIKSKSSHEKQSPSTLDIIGKSQRKPKSCRLNRPKSFTHVAGQRLRECGAAIDHISSTPALTRAITLTLPANHEAAFIALAAYSGYCINRLFQPIRRNYAKECLWFFVWEYQKRGALHLHIALYHPSKEIGEQLGDEMIINWLKILADIGEQSHTDMFVQKDLKTYTPKEKYQNQNQPMRKSLGAYFSKYAGKNESKNNWYCQKYPVSRFWGSCYPLKELVKKLSFDYCLDVDDTRTIEAQQEKIMSFLSKFDLNLQSTYDFAISKTYQDGFRLDVAEGTRMTFYCHPKQYQTILELIRDVVCCF